jgi:ERI1 exoribonuclease 3
LEWLVENGLDPYNPANEDSSFIFLSCGDWDFRTSIRENAKVHNIKLPHCFNKWINVKQAYTDLTGVKAGSMPELLKKCGLELVGHHHSGLDDSQNIANCVIHMLKNLKWIPKATYVLKEDK